ncbi:MAG: hypothetical protein KGL39_27585 [Patescibacteria group bacterium]|nr:hypothetical protein [Patescibacteria group bacterium]
MKPNPNNTPALSPQQVAAKLQAANMAARQQVLSVAYPMLQSIYSNSIDTTKQTQFQLPPQNVGLIKGFLVKLQVTVTNPASGSSTLSLTPMGPGNLLQNIVFTDLQNYQRINTSGWHMAMLNSLRQGRPFLSSTPSDSPFGFGSNWPVIKAPATIAANSSGTIYMYYWIPLAYSENDLTGSIYANVVNATMNLQMTLATAAQAVVANTADPSLAIYQGAGAVAGVTLGNVSVTVYQSYLDQLPMSAQGPILPSVDLNTMYEIKNTSFTGLTTGQDFYVPYSNFRHFLSTMVLLDNQTGGAYPSAGTDVNYFSLRAANATDLRKADPYTWASFARRKLLTDTPVPLYLFDTREKPIYTTQQGNMNIVANLSTVNAGCSLLTGWEMLANVSNLLNASSLASGG